jgi:hypothetical protein
MVGLFPVASDGIFGVFTGTVIDNLGCGTGSIDNPPGGKEYLHAVQKAILENQVRLKRAA